MKKVNNKGMTLVELILVVAITVIVIGALVLFMTTSTRSYHTAESEISLQTEAQVIMNQISDTVIQGNNVLYNSTLHTLTIFHMDEVDLNFDTIDVIWFREEDHKLYLYHITSETEMNMVSSRINNNVVSKENLLGEYVTEFIVDTGIETSPNQFIYDISGKTSTTLSVKLTLDYMGKTYSMKEDMKLRNKIVNIP
jgi:type II secretory pathway pseudopilin PulG